MGKETMTKINTTNLIQSHNIVDVIQKYVPIKKSGKNWFGCCPFHAEKSPSFSVDESKQMFYCFGCHKHGDVISFVMEYSGMEFIDACKELGAQIELMPSKKVEANKKLAENINPHLPSYDKRDAKLSQEIINGLSPCQNGGYEIDGIYYYQVIDFDGEVVNLFAPVDLHTGFIAGGISHLAFTPIRKNDTNNWLVVVDFWQGLKIAQQRQNNVLVTFSAYNSLLVCNHVDDMRKVPVLRYEDTQAEGLCDKGVWIYLHDDGKLTKKKKGEYLD